MSVSLTPWGEISSRHFSVSPPALRVASGGAVFFWRWSSLSHALRYLQFTLMFWSMSQDVSVVLWLDAYAGSNGLLLGSIIKRGCYNAIR